jgi:hypothetical protein
MAPFSPIYNAEYPYWVLPIPDWEKKKKKANIAITLPKVRVVRLG